MTSDEAKQALKADELIIDKIITKMDKKIWNIYRDAIKMVDRESIQLLMDFSFKIGKEI